MAQRGKQILKLAHSKLQACKENQLKCYIFIEYLITNFIIFQKIHHQNMSNNNFLAVHSELKKKAKIRFYHEQGSKQQKTHRVIQCSSSNENKNLETLSQNQSFGKNSHNLCWMCKVYQSKIYKMKDIGKAVTELKQKNFQFIQEIELMLTNFLYILEIVAQTLPNGINSRLSKVLEGKLNIIENQKLTIERLQSQTDKWIDRVDSAQGQNQQVQFLEEKVKKLQVQMEELKNSQNQSYQYKQFYSYPKLSHTTDAETYKSNDKSQIVLNEGHHQHELSMQVDKKRMGITKRRTLEMNVEDKKKESIGPKIQNLKLKIKLIKQKMINGQN